jgi:small subunit ribosomal protein S7
MSRRKAAPKRPILPDPLFGSEMIAKFINCLMRKGKKSVAEKIVYGALEKIVERARTDSGDGDSGKEGGSKGKSGGGSIRTSAAARENALKMFEKALDNVRPTVEVKTRRVGGSNYQIPVEIRPDRRTALGMRWLVEFSSQRSEKTMGLRLASEILEAVQNRGGAVRKRDDVHKMAKANQAFAHYRW